MKKIVFLICISLLLFGCDKKNNNKPNEKLITIEEIKTYLENTLEQYKNSQSGNIFMTITNDNKTSSIEFIYNFNGFHVQGLKFVHLQEDKIYEAYINHNTEYINFNGEKTRAEINNNEELSIISNYSFIKITKEVLNNFDQSLFNSLQVNEDKNNVIQLEWVKDNYELIVDGLSEEEKEDATNRYNFINDNIKSISITIHYDEANFITKLSSIYTTNSDKTKIIEIAFRGFNEQTIIYPDDLNDYVLR